MSVWARDKDGNRVLVKDEDIPQAERAGLQIEEGQEVVTTGMFGTATTDSAERAGAAAAAGKGIETDVETAERQRGERLEEAYSGVGYGAAALGLGALRGASLGTSDLAARALGVEDEVGAIREHRPGLSLAGEITGAVAPALLTGGGSAAAQIAARTPAGLAVRAAGTFRGAVGRGAAEGVLFGAGEGVSELALSDEPINAERIASTLSSHMLYGAGAGVAGGLAGKALEKGLAKASSALRSRTVGGLPESIDDAGAALAREITDYTRARPGAFHVVDAGGTAAPFSKAGARLRHATDNPTGLQRRPQQVLDSLERDAEALRQAIPDADAGMGRLSAEDAEIAARINEAVAGTKAPKIKLGAIDEALPGRYAAWSGRKVGKTTSVDAEDVSRFVATLGDDEADLVAKIAAAVTEAGPRKIKLAKIAKKAPNRYGTWTGRALSREEGKALSVTVDEARAFAAGLDAGELATMRAQAPSAAQELLERNQALQQKIVASIEAGRAPAKAEGFGEKMLKGTVFGGAMGVGSAIGLGAAAVPAAAFAADKIGDLVFRRAGKAAGEAAERLAKALDGVVSVTRRATPATPIITVKALDALRYGPEREDVEGSSSAATAYKRRAAEIRSHTIGTPAGPQMSRQARAQVADRLAPVAAMDPILADQMETAAVRRLEFLASKLPLEPGLGMPTGPNRWEPSHFEIAAFARYAQATEDPVGVLERAGDGTMTPEDAEALREVYPELYGQVQADLQERLPQLREELPYERRLMLGILFGVPVDPAMEPNVMAVLQGHFANEEMSAGGTQAPMPEPSFGALGSQSKPEFTPGQERAG